MKASDACRPRSIARLAVPTPLLVPSFSSRGFPDIAQIHGFSRAYLHRVSLVSAYDIHHGVVAYSDIYATDVLFIDSGGYEASGTVDPAEPYGDLPLGRGWEISNYATTLDCLEPLSRLIAVNFDHTAPAPFDDQISSAISLFNQYPELSSDFLCKPEMINDQFVCIDTVTARANDLAAFDVIGITEKELGSSVLERCQNVLRVRSALHSAGHNNPIHIFGCLDPVTMLAYFMCGADIFDGLAWLRFAFSNGVPSYHATNTILEGRWTESDQDVIAVHRILNLAWLRDQERVMENYSKAHDLSDLTRLPGWTPQVLSLVSAAGLQV